MGQKTNPVGFRLGVIRGWDSNWYTDGTYADKLVEDEEIRRYLHARLKRAGLSRVIIERTPRRVILTLHTSRPGVVIGRGGAEVEKLREELKKLTSKDIQININEIKRPELDASLVAQNIAQQLEGRVPLHTLRADIDYATATAYTIYGTSGVKVWIFHGEIIGKPDLGPNAYAQRQQASAPPPPERRRRDRGGRGDGGRDGGRGRGRGGRRPRRNTGGGSGGSDSAAS